MEQHTNPAGERAANRPTSDIAALIAGALHEVDVDGATVQRGPDTDRTCAECGVGIDGMGARRWCVDHAEAGRRAKRAAQQKTRRNLASGNAARTSRKAPEVLSESNAVEAGFSGELDAGELIADAAAVAS